MITEKERKLKLFKNEAVICFKLVDAAKCCELVDSLGYNWRDGDSFKKTEFDSSEEQTVYDFNLGYFCDEEYYTGEGYNIISADEFLNRHWIPLTGQEIHAGDSMNIDLRTTAPYTYFEGNLVIDSKGGILEFKCLCFPNETFEELLSERTKTIEVDGKHYNEAEVKEKLSQLTPVK